MDHGNRTLRHHALAWLLALAIALASFGHASHGHAKADAPAKTPACAYCSTFERGHAPPPAIAVLAAAVVADEISAVPHGIRPLDARRPRPPTRAPPRRLA